MLTLQIADHKDFMSKLLVSDLFHTWRVRELSITTFTTFQIDGLVHKDFYTTQELETMSSQAELYCAWKEVKSTCFSLIRGTRAPLRFTFTFCLGQAQLPAFVQKTGLTCRAEDISGLYLHVHFENGILRCTTGSSMQTFSMDRTLDQTWDQYIQQFFKTGGIPYELI